MRLLFIPFVVSPAESTCTTKYKFVNLLKYFCLDLSQVFDNCLVNLHYYLCTTCALLVVIPIIYFSLNVQREITQNHSEVILTSWLQHGFFKKTNNKRTFTFRLNDKAHQSSGLLKNRRTPLTSHT